ncbi:hypothetical protein AVEN_169814-1, partial [Araneus ventricosus]
FLRYAVAQEGKRDDTHVENVVRQAVADEFSSEILTNRTRGELLKRCNSVRQRWFIAILFVLYIYESMLNAIGKTNPVCGRLSIVAMSVIQNDINKNCLRCKFKSIHFFSV